MEELQRQLHGGHLGSIPISMSRLKFTKRIDDEATTTALTWSSLVDGDEGPSRKLYVKPEKFMQHMHGMSGGIAQW